MHEEILVEMAAELAVIGRFNNFWPEECGDFHAYFYEHTPGPGGGLLIWRQGSPGRNLGLYRSVGTQLQVCYSAPDSCSGATPVRGEFLARAEALYARAATIFTGRTDLP